MSTKNSESLLDFVNYYRSYTIKIKELLQRELNNPENKQEIINERIELKKTFEKKLIAYFESIK